MRRRVAPVIVAILALSLAACSDDDGDDTASSTTTTSSTTTRPATSTTPASTSPPSSAPASTTPGSLSPQQCAQALFDAWAQGNQGSAPSCASTGAVQSMFAEPFTSGYNGPDCQGAAGSVFCTWTGSGPVITMEVRNTTGGLPVEVLSVTRMGGGT